MEPTLGRIVIYKVSARDALYINSLRTTNLDVATRMESNMPDNVQWPKGSQAHLGFNVSEGDEFPMIIVGLASSVVDGQVFLNGTDTLWVVNAHEGYQTGQWHWPTRVIETTAECAEETKPVETKPTERKVKKHGKETSNV